MTSQNHGTGAGSTAYKQTIAIVLVQYYMRIAKNVASIGSGGAQ